MTNRKQKKGAAKYTNFGLENLSAVKNKQTKNTHSRLENGSKEERNDDFDLKRELRKIWRNCRQNIQ